MDRGNRIDPAGREKHEPGVGLARPLQYVRRRDQISLQDILRRAHSRQYGRLCGAVKNDVGRRCPQVQVGRKTNIAMDKIYVFCLKARQIQLGAAPAQVIEAGNTPAGVRFSDSQSQRAADESRSSQHHHVLCHSLLCSRMRLDEEYLESSYERRPAPTSCVFAADLGRL